MEKRLPIHNRNVVISGFRKYCKDYIGENYQNEVKLHSIYTSSHLRLTSYCCWLSSECEFSPAQLGKRFNPSILKLGPLEKTLPIHDVKLVATFMHRDS